MAGSGYKDYFQVLGVDRGADADTIKRAFRKLARQYHPDVNPGDRSAEAKFKEISEAYEVLSDPDKRRKYEQFGQYWNQAGGMGGGVPGMDVDFGRYGNFDDFINDLLGRFGGPGGPSGFQSGGFPWGPITVACAVNLGGQCQCQLLEAERSGRCLSTTSVCRSAFPWCPQRFKTAFEGKGQSAARDGRRGDLYLNLSVQDPRSGASMATSCALICP